MQLAGIQEGVLFCFAHPYVEVTQEVLFEDDFGPTGEDVRTFQPLVEGKIYIVYAEKKGVNLPDSPQQVDLTVPGMKRINFDGS